ncbi:MAG TPA: TIGR03621 family F420-dependent LLM class oxidoreductase [Candidatus Angelobacter sp.]|nr:TIGR03621 family F420-dependent LLM class oxidoreductase [Candidatus Angelobacter sp.]
MKRPFRFGISVVNPHSRRDFVSLARRSEELGFSTLLLPDHIGSDLQAPFSSLALAAGVTEKIRVGTHMINNDLRHPLLVAHEAATLDLLSDGRLELGIGAGWNEPEYEEMGIRFDSPEVRVERLHESVAIVKRLLTGETVTFDGKHYHMHNHTVGIRSLQRPRPPIAMGGNGELLMSLAAREADIMSFLGLGVNKAGRRLRYTAFTPEGLEKKIEFVRKAAGTRFNLIELAAFIWYFQEGDNARMAASQVRRDRSLSIHDVISSPFTQLGTPEEMIEKLENNRDRFGVNYWVIKSPALEAMKEVVPQLAGR